MANRAGVADAEYRGSLASREVNPLIESPTDTFAESHDESGQTMAEYAVVLGVIVVAVVAALNCCPARS